MKATVAVSALLLSLGAPAQPSPVTDSSRPVPRYQAPAPVLKPEAAPTAPADLQSRVNGVDQQFMIDAIQAGLTEVEMGKLARTNAQSAEIRQFGLKLVEDHQLANRSLLTLTDRLSVTLPGEPDATHQQQLTELKSLQGAAFDRAFVDQMVIRHREVLAIFTREVSYGQQREFRDFAKATLPTLEEHLKTALQLRDGKALSSL